MNAFGVRCKLVWLPVVLFMIGGCSVSNHSITGVTDDLNTSQLNQWTIFLGKWHGKMRTENGGAHEWLVTRQPDGIYRIHFMLHNPDGTFEESVEVGQWGLSGNIYFSIFRGRVEECEFRLVSTGDPYHYDAYQILNLSDNKIDYMHVRTRGKFSVSRVSDDFSIPNSLIKDCASGE